MLQSELSNTLLNCEIKTELSATGPCAYCSLLSQKDVEVYDVEPDDHFLVYFGYHRKYPKKEGNKLREKKSVNSKTNKKETFNTEIVRNTENLQKKVPLVFEWNNSPSRSMKKLLGGQDNSVAFVLLFVVIFMIFGFLFFKRITSKRQSRKKNILLIFVSGGDEFGIIKGNID